MTICFSQKADINLSSVKTIEDAIKMRDGNESDVEIISYLTSVDSSHEIKDLKNLGKGDTTTTGNWKYKIIDQKKVKIYRSSYIYLDGRTMPLKDIDSIRQVIIEGLQKGKPFDEMVARYNMDPKGGDLNWFAEGWMVNEFETAVASNKKGDIFKVDVPSKNWYYVVWKTHENNTSDLIQVIRIKIN